MINSNFKDTSEGSLSTQEVRNLINQFKNADNLKMWTSLGQDTKQALTCTRMRGKDLKNHGISSRKQYISSPRLGLMVKEYCSKYDISETYKEYIEYFSDYELFLTEITNVLFLDCISRKFTVLPLEDFDKMDEVPSDTYFCRAEYNLKKGILEPPITEWNKTCNCKKPLNPDLLYVQCDQCQTWYHLQCIGLTEDQANKIESYKCQNCKR